MGAAATALITPTTVAADSDGTSNDIISRFHRLLEDDPDQAFALLSETGIKYDRVEQSPSDAGGRFSTSDFMSKGDSSVNFYTFEASEFIEVGLTWELLYDTDNYVQGPAPNDVLGLSYDPGVFSYQDDSLYHNGYMAHYNDRADKITGATRVIAEPRGSAIDRDVPQNAAVVEFSDRARHDRSPERDHFLGYGQGACRIHLTKDVDDSQTGVVAGNYTHTWSYGSIEQGVDWGSKVTVNLGVISFDVPSLADSWSLPDNDNRDKEL